MSEDARGEVSRLKELLRQSQKACDQHRKMGEEAESENRDLRRGIEKVKTCVRAISEILSEQFSSDEPNLDHIRKEFEIGMKGLTTLLEKL